MLFYANPYFAIILIIVLKIIVSKFPPLYYVLDQFHKRNCDLRYLFTSPLFWPLIFLTNIAYVCLLARIIELQTFSSLGFLTTIILLTLVNGIAVGWYHYFPDSLAFGYCFVFLAALLLQTVGFLITYLGLLITYPITSTIFLGFLKFLSAWILFIGLTFFIWSSSINYR